MWLTILIHEMKCKLFIDKIIIILLFTQLYCSSHTKISFFRYCKSLWYENYPLKWVSQIPLSSMPTVWTGEGETLLDETKL